MNFKKIIALLLLISTFLFASCTALPNSSYESSDSGYSADIDVDLDNSGDTSSDINSDINSATPDIGIPNVVINQPDSVVIEVGDILYLI